MLNSRFPCNDTHTEAINNISASELLHMYVLYTEREIAWGGSPPLVIESISVSFIQAT